MPVSKKRLEEFKEKLTIIMKSTAHYCEMSDKLIEEVDIIHADNDNLTTDQLIKLEELDKQLEIVQGKILSEQKTQEKFEEEYKDVIEYLHADD
tara:strand:+ start:160 stop:441 length:282 start_codon:yes stop_codon:yes gene_type:complete